MNYFNIFFIYLFFILFSYSHQSQETQNLPIYKILVTGFGPFRDYTDNPSGDIATALNGSCIQYDNLLEPSGEDNIDGDSFILCWDGLVLPVDESGANTVSDQLLQSVPMISDWAAIVHLGLENSSRGLKIETVGANILADTDPDQPAIPGAPEILPTTADLSFLSIPRLLFLPVNSHLVSSARSNENGHILTDSLRKIKLTKEETDEIGIETWSRDAGDYYCNETFFRTLNAVRENLIPVSPSSCQISSSDLNLNKKRKKSRSVSCTDSPSLSMVPVEFVHVPDTSNVDLETSIQLVSRVGAFMVLPSSLTQFS